MSEWKTYKLGDFITHKKGFAFKSDLYKEKGCPIIRVTNFTENSISMNDILFIETSQKNNFKEVEIKEDDIIIATVGSWPNNPSSIVGRVIKAPKVANGSLLNQNAVIIYPNKNLDKKFLYYQLKEKNFSNYLVAGAQGSANQASIKLEQIYSYEFSAPEDKALQKEIAQILSSLDDKIELNLQMNQTIEAMAQALFKEWFVNFNFPNFDGQLENGLPKGWRIGSVLEIATLLSGGTPKTDTDEYWNGSINWISAKDITSSNNQFIIETEKTITELGIKKSAAKLLPKFTTIISARGTVGNYCILSKEMAISQSNYGLKSNSNNDYFLFLMVENMILMMKAFSYGTVFDTITTKTFQEMEVTIPDEKVIKEFETVISPLYEKILTNQIQIQTLTQTRDTLLPKLMTGKIEISN